MKIVGLVLHYNVPEVTDRCVQSIRSVAASLPLEVIDNGSDPGLATPHATFHLAQNQRMTRGFNAGIRWARQQHPDLDGIWFFTSDCWLQASGSTDPDRALTRMIDSLRREPRLGILHPAADPSVVVDFDIYYKPGRSGVRIWHQYDFVCPLFTRSALELLDWQFDARLYYGWGVDYDTSWQVRAAGQLVGLHNDVIYRHDTSTTYDQGRDETFENRTHFYESAGSEFQRVLGDKYGMPWPTFFHTRFLREHAAEINQWIE